MKLSDFLNRIGSHSLIIYNIHWDLYGEETMVSSDFIDAIIDLFPDYYIQDEDSIYMSIENNKIIVDLYVYKFDDKKRK